MRFLIDTHVFLWWLGDSGKLSDLSRKMIRNRDNEIFFSLASVWEIAIKISLGKLTLALPLDRFMTEQLAHNGFHLLPLDFRHVTRVETLPFHHRDPFDRLLVAQSLEENLPLITADTVVEQYQVMRIW
ncbi:MAG: type II toxin-antitoxin system VapC family toxin [Leptospirillia bacterium]